MTLIGQVRDRPESSFFHVKFVARDLVDDHFVRKAINAVGGPSTFGLPADLLRGEILAV
jgi:NitT/TauT family transport system substrate-binding protein